MPGAQATVRIELNIIADIGFVGFPNAGKSSLLTVLSNARPEVAAYPFTTKIPHLGVMNFRDHDLILADIPGIIEGAADGAGLGLRFLKHISRTKGLAFLIDLSDPNYETAYESLTKELEEYSPDLLGKESVIIGTKLDLPETEEHLKILTERYPEMRVLGISAFTHSGLEELKKEFLSIMLEQGRKNETGSLGGDL
jgi:GTP-binding protein